MNPQIQTLTDNEIPFVVLPFQLAHLATLFNCPIIVGYEQTKKPHSKDTANTYTLEQVIQMAEDCDNQRINSMKSSSIQTDDNQSINSMTSSSIQTEDEDEDKDDDNQPSINNNQHFIQLDTPTLYTANDNQPSINNTPHFIQLDTPTLYTANDIKQLLTTKYYKPSTVKSYTNDIKNILGKEPFNFKHFEENHITIIQQLINNPDTDYKYKYRLLIILLKTYELIPQFKPDIIEYIEKIRHSIASQTHDETILQPPTDKEIENKITLEQLKHIRDTLYDKVITSNTYDTDCIAFLASSIYLNCPPIRPGEITNTTTTKTKLKEINYLDIPNLKWHIDNRKNGDTNILDINQSLADDILLVHNKHKSIHLIPQLRKNNYHLPMAERQMLREVQKIFKEQFNIPNFTFQINRKSQISNITPDMTGPQKKEYAKQCGHSVQTQQMIYNAFNQ